MLDIAWAAGLFEGEGNLYIGNKNKGPGHNGGITAAVGMTDLGVIDRLHALFPGKRYVKSREGCKDLLIATYESPRANHNRRALNRGRVVPLTAQGRDRNQISAEFNISPGYVTILRREARSGG